MTNTDDTRTYTDKHGDLHAGTLEEIGDKLAREYGDRALDAAGIEPWHDLADDGNETPRAFTASEWAEWVAKLEDRTERDVLANLGDGTKWTATRVLNREDVPADVVPASYTAARDGSPAPRWTIQGNHLALIARVILDDELAELVAAELEA